ncbi:hypothetical protein CBR_g40624 [Chara braunii]|uniref:Uncharacterized protein n=1 Tax=Chara braunii TaxID=69332 RepID=A0A388LU11_CHABU|nr:hypothetical protein CBR_g40624 [Chara braunii]|eukprot:GBG85814.1 hypothetical protein CBR_g40624 [Chara braunii]
MQISLYTVVVVCLYVLCDKYFLQQSYPRHTSHPYSEVSLIGDLGRAHSLHKMEELMGGRWSPEATRNFAKGPPSRNSPCPCGSGKKYKRCCGKLTSTL